MQKENNTKIVIGSVGDIMYIAEVLKPLTNNTEHCLSIGEEPCKVFYTQIDCEEAAKKLQTDASLIEKMSVCKLGDYLKKMIQKTKRDMYIILCTRNDKDIPTTMLTLSAQ